MLQGDNNMQRKSIDIRLTKHLLNRKEATAPFSYLSIKYIIILSALFVKYQIGTIRKYSKAPMVPKTAGQTMRP